MLRAQHRQQTLPPDPQLPWWWYVVIIAAGICGGISGISFWLAVNLPDEYLAAPSVAILSLIVGLILFYISFIPFVALA